LETFRQLIRVDRWSVTHFIIYTVIPVSQQRASPVTHNTTIPPIALLTDFGLKDHYVGVMKGVMQQICPSATFIDITHDIPAQNLEAGRFVLNAAFSYFAKGTLFLIVVDPGVGTQRRPIWLETADYTFVAPDNGILTDMIDHYPDSKAFEILPETLPDFADKPVSHTFHGRDIFAPAAAALAQGLALKPIREIRLEKLVTLPAPPLDIQENSIHGEVIYIDTLATSSRRLAH